LLPILALIQGIRAGFEIIGKMFKKESNEGETAMTGILAQFGLAVHLREFFFERYFR
jgi:formate-dependent nitrite reductase membrane component NrfD